MSKKRPYYLIIHGFEPKLYKTAKHLGEMENINDESMRRCIHTHGFYWGKNCIVWPIKIEEEK